MDNTLTQKHDLAQAYQTAVAANAAKRAAEAAALRAILCGDDARHTPKVMAVANPLWQAWSAAAAYAETLPVGTAQEETAWSRAEALWQDYRITVHDASYRAQ